MACIISHLSPETFRVKVRDINRSIILQLMIMEYCELLNQNNLRLLEKLELLIDMNLVITYLPDQFLH